MNRQQAGLEVTRNVLNAFVNWVDLIKSGLFVFVLYGCLFTLPSNIYIYM